MICELTNKMDTVALKILWFNEDKEFTELPKETSISDFLIALFCFIGIFIAIVWWWIPVCLLTEYWHCLKLPFGFMNVKRFKCGKR